MKCLFCKIRSKKNSLKCRFCDYFLESPPEMGKTLAYLENGFEKINEELDDIEGKVNQITGLVFRRHRYTAEDLLDSSQMNRIQSLAGKIKDDVSRWDANGKMPYRLKLFYNENAESAQSRMRMINQIIQDRRPTLWEKVGGFFRQLYRIIVELLPIMLQRLVYSQRPKAIDKAA
jgi:hypothetical protein